MSAARQTYYTHNDFITLWQLSLDDFKPIHRNLRSYLTNSNNKVVGAKLAKQLEDILKTLDKNDEYSIFIKKFRADILSGGEKLREFIEHEKEEAGEELDFVGSLENSVISPSAESRENYNFLRNRGEDIPRHKLKKRDLIQQESQESQDNIDHIEIWSSSLEAGAKNLNEGNYHSARREFQRVVEVAGNSSVETWMANLGIAELDYRQGEIDDATIKIIEINKQFVALADLSERAQRDLRWKKFEKDLYDYTEFMAQIHLDLGNEKYENSQFSEAEKEFGVVTALLGSSQHWINLSSHIMLGCLHMQKENLDAAALIFEEVRSALNAMPQPLNENMQWVEGSCSQAQILLLRAYNAIAYKLLEEKDYESASAVLLKSSKLVDDHSIYEAAYTHYTLGLAYNGMRQHQNAFDSFQKAETILASDFTIDLATVGIIQLHELARKMLKASSINLNYELGLAYIESSQFTLAEEVLKKIFPTDEKQPNYKQLHAVLLYVISLDAQSNGATGFKYLDEVNSKIDLAKEYLTPGEQMDLRSTFNNLLERMTTKLLVPAIAAIKKVLASREPTLLFKTAANLVSALDEYNISRGGRPLLDAKSSWDTFKIAATKKEWSEMSEAEKKLMTTVNDEMKNVDLLQAKESIAPEFKQNKLR
jgi:Tfp pilus assembly protein PilF